MPLFEKKRETFKRKNLRKLRPQKKKENVLTVVKKGTSRENAASLKLIVRKQIITGKNEAEEFKKSLNNTDFERRPVVETQIKLSLRW